MPRTIIMATPTTINRMHPSTLLVTMLVDSVEAARAAAGHVGSLFGLGADDMLRMPLALIGTPADCAAELERREREWGVTHYIVSGFSGSDYPERFAREVLPRIAAA